MMALIRYYRINYGENLERKKFWDHRTTKYKVKTMFYQKTGVNKKKGYKATGEIFNYPRNNVTRTGSNDQIRKSILLDLPHCPELPVNHQCHSDPETKQQKIKQ